MKRIPVERYTPRGLPPSPSPSAAPKLPFWNVPAHRNPHFTGRDKLLKELHDRLHRPDPRGHIQVLHGLAGAGKTQVAVEYAYQHRGDYPIVAWLRADVDASLQH